MLITPKVVLQCLVLFQRARVHTHIPLEREIRSREIQVYGKAVEMGEDTLMGAWFLLFIKQVFIEYLLCALLNHFLSSILWLLMEDLVLTQFSSRVTELSSSVIIFIYF
jgi:hypothetical protein